MISNNFIDTYQRGESNRLEQQQLFFQVDNVDVLRYTANGFPNIINFTQDTINELSVARNAKTCNLIIDNITLFTSNPDISRYFPLKIKINGDQEIEFDDRELTIIDRYPLPLQQYVNRFDTLKSI